MDSAIIVAVISFLGTLIGTAGGIIASSKLTQYRLEQLEKKVDAQYRVASRLPVLEERVSSVNRRVHAIEKRQAAQYDFLAE